MTEFLFLIRNTLQGTGKNRSLYEALRPMVSTIVACIMFFIWVRASRNDILNLDPRCMFFLTGTVFSNICCKLIIAQMSNTRSELFSMILAPTALTILFCLVIPNISYSMELAAMYLLTGNTFTHNIVPKQIFSCRSGDTGSYPLWFLCCVGDV